MGWQELLGSGQGNSFTKSRELLWEAQELVFLKRKLQGRLGCVLLSLNLQCLNPSRSIPRAPLHHPSTLPTFCLLRF